MYVVFRLYIIGISVLTFIHRDWKIKLFSSGDYEFLCVMYGLTGASGELSPSTLHQQLHKRDSSFPGRHCCSWCKIRNTEVKVPIHTRGRLPSRSLESFRSDHQRFLDAGGNLKKAKEFKTH